MTLEYREGITPMGMRMFVYWDSQLYTNFDTPGLGVFN